MRSNHRSFNGGGKRSAARDLRVEALG